MRRAAASLLLAFLLLWACGGDDDAPAGDAGADGGPGRTDAGMPDANVEIPFRIPESEAAAGREACMFERGAMPWETIGEEHPIGEDIPIDHVIMVMQENRSFDHYFGAMEGIDGFPDGYSNPDTDGTPIEVYHESQYCIVDVAHSWNASHIQYGGGANDGFVTTNNPNGGRGMGYFTDADLPYSPSAILAVASRAELADVAVGARDLAVSGKAAYGAGRRVSSALFGGLVARAFSLGVGDTQCGLKAFRAPVARDLFEASVVEGFAFDVELLVLARHWGLRVAQVPVTMRPVRGSSVRLLPHALRMARELAEIRRRERAGLPDRPVSGDGRAVDRARC